MDPASSAPFRFRKMSSSKPKIVCSVSVSHVLPQCLKAGRDDRRGWAWIEWLAHGDEDVLPLVRHVTPTRRPLVVHGDRVAIRPEEVHRHVAEKLITAAIGARINPAYDFGLLARFFVEISFDHGFELLQSREDGEVALGEKVEREHNAAVPVDYEALHGFFPLE